MVYVPGITKSLYRRKGGGGKGKGGGGGGGSGDEDDSSDSSSDSDIQKNFDNIPTGKTSVTTYSKGGGPVSTIQSGLFMGRTVGGGTRADVFGNRFV